jgi:hypothetical protein
LISLVSELLERVDSIEMVVGIVLVAAMVVVDSAGVAKFSVH